MALLVFWALSPACARRPERVVFGLAVTSSSHPAALLAVKQINAGGGIDGVPVELAGLDWRVRDRFEPEDILKWAHKYADTPELLAVIGHSDSRSTLAAAAEYNRLRIPQIVTIATNPAITNIGGWTYRLCISDALQGAALAEYAVRDWAKRRIAVFYVNDDYGRVLTRIFEDHVRGLGGEIIFSVMHRDNLEPDDQELIQSNLIRSRKTREPDLLALFQRMDAARWTIAAARKVGLAADILGSDSLGPIGFVQASPEITEGMRIAQFFLALPENKRSVQFVRDFVEYTGKQPDYAQAFTYDAVLLLRDAVRAGGFTHAEVRAYLDSLIENGAQLDGVAGPYAFGSDHDARRAFHIVEARGPTHRLLKSLKPD